MQQTGVGRRGFLCFCCAGVAAAATPARAAWDASPPSTFRRTILNTTDYPDGHVVIQAAVEVDPGAVIAQHTHPGIEAAFIVDGGGELVVAGVSRQVRAGDAFEIPREAVHGLRNGPQTTKILVTYVVEKDKPLATPAPS
jgi:quercetin dioxygenase-like cupin family protein